MTERTYPTAIRNMLGDIDSLMEAVKDSARVVMQPDDDMIMKRLVQQIIVGDAGIEIRLQCGVSTKQEYV